MWGRTIAPTSPPGGGTIGGIKIGNQDYRSFALTPRTKDPLRIPPATLVPISKADGLHKKRAHCHTPLHPFMWNPQALLVGRKQSFPIPYHLVRRGRAGLGPASGVIASGSAAKLSPGQTPPHTHKHTTLIPRHMCEIHQLRWCPSAMLMDSTIKGRMAMHPYTHGFGIHKLCLWAGSRASGFHSIKKRRDTIHLPRTQVLGIVPLQLF